MWRKWETFNKRTSQHSLSSLQSTWRVLREKFTHGCNASTQCKFGKVAHLASTMKAQNEKRSCLPHPNLCDHSKQAWLHQFTTISPNQGRTLTETGLRSSSIKHKLKVLQRTPSPQANEGSERNYATLRETRMNRINHDTDLCDTSLAPEPPLYPNKSRSQNNPTVARTSF